MSGGHRTGQDYQKKSGNSAVRFTDLKILDDFHPEKDGKS